MLFLRKLHKWLGLVVGLQLILWTISGAVFAWLDHHDVSAEHSVARPDSPALSPSTAVANPAKWLSSYQPQSVHELRLVTLLDETLWRIQLTDRVELRRAADGGRVQIGEQHVRRLAAIHYMGAGHLTEVIFQLQPGLETRKSGPVWRASFDDAPRTTLYFAADDGRLVAVRNSSWRIFDFFWMLHTMDYSGRDNFNNPLVITAATGALWLSLSGLFLLTRSFRRHDFAMLRPASGRNRNLKSFRQ